MTRLNRLVADSNNPRSLAAKARSRRWDAFLDHFPDLAEMKVLDLGGQPGYWRSAAVRPSHVTMVNVRDEPCEEPWLDLRIGDACDPPADGDYDVVISNSLLEHVGGHWRRRQLAEVIRSRSDNHWVQTPYRYFPMEPHWLFPGFQFLPAKTRAVVAQRWPLGYMRNKDPEGALADVLETELVSIAELQMCFPDSMVWRERFAGLVKSIVAVRSPLTRR